MGESSLDFELAEQYAAEAKALRAQLRASEAEAARLTRELEDADGRRRECRQLLARMVKYCREDKARTPGVTRLARLVEQVADYLNRTHNPRDILRQEQEKKDV